MSHSSHNKHKLAEWGLHAGGLAAVGLALLAFYHLVYLRLAEQGETHAIRAEQLQKLLATAESVRDNHRSFRIELEKLEIETASMRSRLPQDLQKSQFESSLRNAAATTAFKFGAAQWKPSATTSTHSRAEVTVTGNGSFASICKFLNEINQLARITKISSLALETSNESASYPLEVTFVLVYGIESNDTDRTGGVL
ncbi:MAG: type 4a pilus biogenesis protein PilO [Planctomycetales bacterium]|nr:type 4a pilus biogenesis protein PilO [Planctomycetales bacterium]